jgi:hypothetical protein
VVTKHAHRLGFDFAGQPDSSITSKIWNLGNDLCNDGIRYGDYLEQVKKHNQNRFGFTEFITSNRQAGKVAVPERKPSLYNKILRFENCLPCL